MIVENFDCLRIDLTVKDDKNMGIVTGSHAEKETSSLHKPEVVIIEGMAEKTFNMEMKSVMRKLGYSGFLENVRQGKGTAMFIRNDKLKKKTPLPATVFAFTLRYLLVWTKNLHVLNSYWMIIDIYLLEELCPWKKQQLFV